MNLSTTTLSVCLFVCPFFYLLSLSDRRPRLLYCFSLGIRAATGAALGADAAALSLGRRRSRERALRFSKRKEEEGRVARYKHQEPNFSANLSSALIVGGVKSKQNVYPQSLKGNKMLLSTHATATPAEEGEERQSIILAQRISVRKCVL